MDGEAAIVKVVSMNEKENDEDLFSTIAWRSGTVLLNCHAGPVT